MGHCLWMLLKVERGVTIMNLLIVDDDPIAIRGIMEGVAWERLEIDKIYSANSAQQARDVLKKDKVDIILCDIEMAQEDGLSFIHWIRENFSAMECVFITCHASFDFAREAILLQSFDYLLKPVSYEKLEAVLQSVIEKIHRRMDQNKVLQYGEMYLENIVDNVRAKNDTKKTPGEIVEEVSRYIRMHLSEDLNVEDIAGQVYLNPDYLTRIFKKETGTSLIKFIIQERMYMARKLLCETSLSVNGIALEVGFSDYSHFTKTFRQMFGMTPSVYRQKMKETQNPEK